MERRIKTKTKDALNPEIPSHSREHSNEWFARCSLTSRSVCKKGEAMRSVMMSMLLLVCVAACTQEQWGVPYEGPRVVNRSDAPDPTGGVEFGGGGVSKDGTGGKISYYRIPLPPGYGWEVSQSWAEHCEECDVKYPPSGAVDDKPYCESSHANDCYSACKYGWDFNLELNQDSGLPVLASGPGSVDEVSYGTNAGWGNFVLLHHNNGICTRYAHLLDNSILVVEGQEIGQGQVLAAIGGTPNYSPHLHFQFEDCDSHDPLEMGFDDGNGVPKCIKGNDVYDGNGVYTALKLTNRVGGGPGGLILPDEVLPEGGWINGNCGQLNGCPMVENCERIGNANFIDESQMEEDFRKAVNYLWGECAIRGKADGAFRKDDLVTRAEALKVALMLFGHAQDCGLDLSEVDEGGQDWHASVFACGIGKAIITPSADLRPNDAVTMAEAAKILVVAAVNAGVIQLKDPAQGHLSQVAKDHWAFKYMETLYAYGALRKLNNPGPNAHLPRVHFAYLAAALSPCFCGNVSCAGICQCTQEVHSCVDPNQNGSELGGTAQLEVSCDLDSGRSGCEGQSALLDIRCRAENRGASALKLRNLMMKMNDHADGSVCVMDQSSLWRGGVGYQRLDGGETRRLTGSFKIRCVRSPLDGDLQTKLDVLLKENGTSVLHEDMLDLRVRIGNWPSDNCQANAQSVPADLHQAGIGNCAPESCGNRVCGTWPDGCGGRIDCGGFCPSGQECTTQGQCVVPQSAGQQCTRLTCQQWNASCGSYDDGCGGMVNCGGCGSGNCVNRQCVLPPPPTPPPPAQLWQCNSATGYTLWIDFPGGSWEILTRDGSQYSGGFQGNPYMWVTFDCSELPAVMMVRSGSGGVRVWTHDSGLPVFSVWANYTGPLVINPAWSTTLHVNAFTDLSASNVALVRIPAN